MKNTSIYVKVGIVILAAVLMVGCASSSNLDYYRAVDASNLRAAEIARGNSDVEVTRINALSSMASSDDPVTRTAAIMALAFSGNVQSNAQSSVAVPQKPVNEALQWASILVPSLTNLGMGAFVWDNQKTQTLAQRDITMSTNQSFVDLGNSIGNVGLTGMTLIPRDPLVIGNGGVLNP